MHIFYYKIPFFATIPHLGTEIFLGFPIWGRSFFEELVFHFHNFDIVFLSTLVILEIWDLLIPGLSLSSISFCLFSAILKKETISEINRIAQNDFDKAKTMLDNFNKILGAAAVLGKQYTANGNELSGNISEISDANKIVDYL